MSVTRLNSENDSKMLSFKNKLVREAKQETASLNLVVQGRKVSYCGPPDVYSLLEFQGENPLYVNVRINGTVLNRRDFENILLHDGDEVDFLYFMGGGIV